MTDRLDVPIPSRRRLPVVLDRALTIAVLEDDNDETRRTKRLLTGALWTAVLMPWPLIVQLIAANAPVAAWIVTTSFLSAAGVLIALRLRPSSFPGVIHVVVAVNLGIAVAMTLLFGGFLESGTNFVFSLALVVGALAAFGDWRATVWFWVAVVAFVGSTIGSRFVEPLYVHPAPELAAVMSCLLILVFCYFVLWYYVQQRAELLRLSDGLLKNILPDSIATRLKASESMIADQFEATSILFADVAGFTPLSADMRPDELVALLNEIFSDFDAMVEACGLEKIKTIGDAYMVAAGVPASRPDHALAMCGLALEMQHHVQHRQFSGRTITFRIGINSGPVVAGIIGTRKFSYDLWGDSVNTASRMESSGRPGRIQITEATRDLVADEYTCEPGGMIDVKGKGPMPVWFLEGPLPATTEPPHG